MEAHVTTWAGVTDPTTIGLTGEQVNQLTTLVTAARGGLDDAEAARITSKTATEAWYSQYNTARAFCASLVADIKHFAESTGNPGVYTIAEISAPEPPSTRPAPPPPTNVTSSLASDGSVVIKWKSREADGATFAVYRRLDGEGAFTLAGFANGKKKEYRDLDVPPGATQAAYHVIATRSNLESLPSDNTTVYFGVPGDAPAQQSQSA